MNYEMFIKDLFNSLIILFVSWLIKETCLKIYNYILDKTRGFTIEGCWYAEHGSYISKDIRAIEIVYIWQKGEFIRYRMEQYTNIDDKKHLCLGKGLMKANIISSYYYPIRNRKSKLIGCMNLSVKTLRASEVYLVGSFYEVDERKEQLGFLEYPSDYYKLYQTEKLRFGQKLRIKYYKNVFSSYEEARKFIQYEKM